jgi:hypothetical protein
MIKIELTTNKFISFGFAILLSVLLMSCYKTPKQSALMAEYDIKEFTAMELKIRLNDYAVLFRGIVEESADHIINNTNDADIKRNALLWKIYAITTSQNAIYLIDPLVAALDIWTFCIQMRMFFTEGNGSQLFGEWQYIAINAAEQLENEIFNLAQAASGKADMPNAIKFVNSWAQENPIENLFFIRKSTNEYYAKILGARGFSLSETVGTLATSVFDIRQRLSIYTDQLPKQFKWQFEYFEYLIDDYIREIDIEGMQEKILSLTESLNRITQFIESSPELIDSTRILTLDEINRERIATLNAMHKELIVLLGALREERIATLSEIDRERIETIKALEILLAKALEESKNPINASIDHFFWRAIQLIFIAAILTFIILFIFRRKRA